jgi:TP901 family phage tail tape measure protein
MAKVRAVSGASNRDFQKLSRTAKELGRTTFFTATQVGALQENYAKLGFTTEEILNAQAATIQLATATGSDLARAAIVAGSAVRGFGLDASETQRVVDVMAVSFTSSALDIEKWQTSMTKVAPIAKAAGFSIEDTAAIMAKLADSGIEASIAGTSLRNILLKMQDPTSDLTRAFGSTIHSFDQLLPAMKKFVEEGGSMADIMEVVDLRQAAAFEQMLTSADSALQLRDALNEASGAAANMSAIIADTLEGDIRELTSAWEGFQIGVVEGSGKLTRSIRNVLDVTTELLNKLTNYNKTNKDFAQDIVAEQMSIVRANMEDQIELFKTLSEEDQKIYGKTKSEFIKQRINALTEEVKATAKLRNTKNALNQDSEEESEKYSQLQFALAELQTLYREQVAVEKDSSEEKQKGTKRTIKQTKAIQKNTKSVRSNIKAKKDSFDLEAEQIDLLMTKGVTTAEEEARITEYLNDLRRKEIELQLKSMSQFVMNADLRKKLLLELEELDKQTDEQNKERKDEMFKDDVKRAIMSGQTAEEAMKTVVRAQIMEAVAGFIASIFKGVPFPVNLVLAAGASALVGNLIDGQLEKFANGGMVQGKSHANGGEKFAVGGRVVELEGGEAVINKRSTSMFRNQLSAMNAAGGGVKFADGGLLNMPSFSQQQFNALGQSQMMGAMGSSGKVVVVEADITDSQNTVNVIQSEATI